MSILLLHQSFALIQLLRIGSELITLLNNRRDLLSRIHNCLGLLLDLHLLKVYLPPQLVSLLLVRRDVLNGAVQDRKLLLQELHGVIRYLLLHLQVEVLVAECLVLGQVLPELVAELFAELLRNERDVDELLGLVDFLGELELETHVDFDLTLELEAKGVDLLLHVEVLAVDDDELFLIGVAFE